MNNIDPVADGRLTDSDSSVHMDPSAPAAAPPTGKECVYTFSDNCDSDDGEELKFKIKNILQAPLKDETAATATAQVVDTGTTDAWNAPESAAAAAATTLTTNTLVSALFKECETCEPRRATNDDDRMDTDHFHGFTPPTAVAAFVHNHEPPPDSSNAGTHDRLSPPTATASATGQPPSPIGSADQPSIDQPPLVHSDIASQSYALPTHMPPVPFFTNGCIPKTGKPLTFACNAAADETAVPSRVKRPVRGHSRPKRKALITMYQSQISDNTMGGIKLKLKKSSSLASAVSQAATAVAATITGRGATSGSKRRVRSAATGAPKKNRKRVTRKSASDSSDDESGDGAAGGPAVKRVRKANINRKPKAIAGSAGAAVSVVDQSDWGARLPEPALYLIFQEAVRQEGTLPTLVRLGKVCQLWQSVSLASSLWQTLDLSRWTKEKFRTELRLKWLIENRCRSCVELNVCK